MKLYLTFNGHGFTGAYTQPQGFGITIGPTGESQDFSSYPSANETRTIELNVISEDELRTLESAGADADVLAEQVLSLENKTIEANEGLAESSVELERLSKILIDNGLEHLL